MYVCMYVCMNHLFRWGFGLVAKACCPLVLAAGAWRGFESGRKLCSFTLETLCYLPIPMYVCSALIRANTRILDTMNYANPRLYACQLYAYRCLF
jgi:hypothetical protein